jgi:exonuclease III
VDAQVESGVLKVVRVKPRSSEGRARFDLFVSADNVSEIFSQVSGVIPRNWRLKVSQRWSERPSVRARIRQEVADKFEGFPHGNTGFQMMSLNINGLKNKRQELDWWLFKLKVPICCLQETFLREDRWSLRLKGYVAHAIGGSHEASGAQRGKRGLVTLVHSSVPSYLVHKSRTQGVLWVKIFPTWAPRGIMVGNIYLPHGRRRHTVLEAAIKKFRVFSRSGPVILMGDFNLPQETVATSFMRHMVPVFHPVGKTGPSYCPRKGSKGSAIDFCVYDGEFADLGRLRHKVCRRIRMSDHWPYLLNMDIASEPVPDAPHGPRFQRVDGSKWWEKRAVISTNNRWEPLAELMDDEETEEGVLFDRMVKTTLKVCGEAGLVHTYDVVSKKVPFTKTYTLPPRIGRMYERAGRVFADCCESVNDEERMRGYRRSRTLRKQAAKACREFSANSWRQFVHEKTDLLIKHESRKWWRITRAMMQVGAKVCPVRNDDNELVITGEAVMDAWRQHFKRVVTDDTGWSTDASRWASHDIPERETMPGISEEFSWAELRRCILTSKAGKSPGRSGIPVEVWKMCSGEKETTEPPNYMALALLRLVNRMFCCQDLTKLPDVALEKWFVAIPKKGDLSQRDNYRGIVLMDTILKLITRMLGTRCMECLDRQRILIREQGGFRPRRECVAQVLSLLEMAGRMKPTKKNMYILFVDIVKAYDRVPHEALFRKLNAVGFRGTALNFIRQMYGAARLRVRTAHGLSEVFEQNIGVPQGGPFSTTAFDVYINDFFAHMADLRWKGPGLVELFLGLLFADDAALMVIGVKNLVRAAHAVKCWGDEWRLEFGVKADGSKCAILPLGERAASRLSKKEVWLGNKVVPVVDKYVYLGIPLDTELSIQTIRDAALERGWKAYRASCHILGNSSMPVASRLLVFKAMVLSAACYGSEIWGGVKSNCRGFNVLMRKGLSLCFGYSAKATGSPYFAMGIEAGVSPIYVRTTVSRMRLYEKMRTSQDDSWLKLLIECPAPPGFRRNSWVRQSFMLKEQLIRQFGASILVDGSQVDLHLDRLTERLWLASDTDSRSTRMARRFKELYPRSPWSPLKEWLEMWRRIGGSAMVETQFLKLRMGLFFTTQRYAKRKLLPECYKNQCMFCDAPEGESEVHLIFKCPAWDLERVSMMSDYTRILPGLSDNMESLERVLGSHPVSLESVGLHNSAAEKEANVHRGWIRARGPIWGFLLKVLPQRWSRIRVARKIWEGEEGVRASGEVTRRGSDPRGEARSVGRANPAAMDTCGF